MLHTANMARMDKPPRARPHYRPTTRPTHAIGTMWFVQSPEVLEPQPASREGELQGHHGRPPEAYNCVLRERVKRPRTRAAPAAPHGGTATNPAAPAEAPRPSSSCRRWLSTAATQSGTTAARAPQVCHSDAHAVLNWRATARGGGGELHLVALHTRRENYDRDLLGRRPATRGQSGRDGLAVLHGSKRR